MENQSEYYTCTSSSSLMTNTMANPYERSQLNKLHNQKEKKARNKFSLIDSYDSEYEAGSESVQEKNNYSKVENLILRTFSPLLHTKDEKPKPSFSPGKDFKGIKMPTDSSLECLSLPSALSESWRNSCSPSIEESESTSPFFSLDSMGSNHDVKSKICRSRSVSPVKRKWLVELGNNRNYIKSLTTNYDHCMNLRFSCLYKTANSEEHFQRDGWTVNYDNLNYIKSQLSPIVFL